MSTEWKHHQHLLGSDELIEAVDDLCVYAKLADSGEALERHRERAERAGCMLGDFLERLASWSRERQGVGMILGADERERRLVDSLARRLDGIGGAGNSLSLDRLATLVGSVAEQGPGVRGIVPELQRIREILQADVSIEATRILGDL